MSRGPEASDGSSARGLDQQDGAVQAVLITDLGELEPLHDSWRTLAHERGNPHLTPEFYHSWVESFAAQATPCVPVVLDARGELLGLLPLVITTDVLRQAQFVGAGFWMAVHPVSRIADERLVARLCGQALGQRHHSWREIAFEDAAPAGAAWIDDFVGAVRAAHPRRVRETRRAQPWLIADISGSWDDYLGRHRSKVRHDMRRIENRLHESYAVTARTSSSIAELRRDLDVAFGMHHTRRQERGGSTFEDVEMRNTLERFAERAFEQGGTQLRVLEVEGRPVAAALSFVAGDRAAGYLLAWDQALGLSGLGRIIIFEGFRCASEAGALEFDLSTGSTEVKARIATEERSVEAIWLRPPRAATLLALRRLARRLLPVGARRFVTSRLLGRADRLDEPLSVVAPKAS